MDDFRPIIVDLDESERSRLEALAAHEEQSVDELATSVLRARLARHEAYLRAIDEGLAAAAEGHTYSDEEFWAIRAEERRRYIAERGL